MKINKQNKNGKEVSIVYGEDNSINVSIFDNKILIVDYDNDKTSDEKIISILTDKTTYVVEKIDESKKITPINWFKKIINF